MATHHNAKPPELIYRYRPLQDGLLERELTALNGSYVFAPSFADLNDPMEAFYETGSPNDSFFSALVPGGHSAIERMYEMHREMTSNFAIISFSTQCDDLPMWAYYASNFAGICLEFNSLEILVGDLKNETLAPVTYAREPTRPIDISDFAKLQINASTIERLTRKRIEWAHEKEWRFITGQSGPKFYLDDALTRVFLGPKIKPDHARQVCSILDRRPVEILQGFIDGFELRFRQLKSARPIQECERVGAGKFDPTSDLYAELELTKFLNVPISQLHKHCRQVALRPNMESFSAIDIASGKPEAIYLWAVYKLRNGRDVYDRKYFDRNMQLSLHRHD